jgi:hypothetical protein
MFFDEGIEGYYLLRGIPYSEAKYIPPQEFPDNARESILACLDCVIQLNLFKFTRNNKRVE